MLAYCKVSTCSTCCYLLQERWEYVANWLIGSFVHLTPKTVPRHDIIVSTEGNDRHSRSLALIQ